MAHLLVSKAGPRGRRGVLGSLLVVAAVLLPAAIAWACNPQAQLRLDKSAYTPGETVNVSGRSFGANTDLRVSVENRQTSAVREVARVRTNSSGSFNTSFAADPAPGAYTVFAQGVPTGGEGATVPAPAPAPPALASFDVTPEPAPGDTRPTRLTSPSQRAFAPTPGPVTPPARQGPTPQRLSRSGSAACAKRGRRAGKRSARQKARRCRRGSKRTRR